MENLLIEDTKSGKEPYGPTQFYCGTVKLSEVKPWCVGAGNEEVDHGTVAAVQQVPPDAFVTDCSNSVENSRDCEQSRQHCTVYTGSPRRQNKIFAKLWLKQLFQSSIYFSKF